MNQPENDRSQHSSSDPKLISEFSTYQVENNSATSKPVTIPELRSIFIWLIEGLTLSEDGWARYFLLTLRQDDLALLHPANQEAQVIARHLRNKKVKVAESAPRLSLDTTLFLDSPQRQIQQILVVYLQKVVYHTARSYFYQQFLFVYLQKIVYQAVRSYYHNVVERLTLAKQYSQDDLRYQVLDKANDPVTFLHNFESKQIIKVRTYTNRKVEGMVRDHIRRDNFSYKVRSMSDQGLLKGLTYSQFGKALKAVNQLKFPGIQTTTKVSQSEHKQVLINCYLDVIGLYRQVYTPQGGKNDRLPPPTQEQLQTIADLYNQEPPEAATKLLTQTDVQTILATSVQAARNYYGAHPGFYSLDEPMRSDNLGDTARTLELADPNESGLQQFIRHEEQKTITDSITQAFAALHHPEPLTLYLKYGLKLTQETILHLLGTELGVKDQPGVSRRIKSFKRKLIQSLIQSWQSIWETHYGYPVDPATLAQCIADLEPEINEYLEIHCQRVFYPILDKTLAQLNSGDPTFKLNAHPSMDELYPSLQNALKKWIQAEFSIDLQAVPVASELDKKLDRLITTWFY